jgi:hypothetical protein
MMQPPSEGAQAGGDGVVAAWFNAHVIGGIGIHEVDRGTLKESIYIFSPTAITAQQPVAAEVPQVTNLRCGCVRRLGHVIGIGKPGAARRFEQA